jgi:hypothetical protein
LLFEGSGYTLGYISLSRYFIFHVNKDVTVLSYILLVNMSVRYNEIVIHNIRRHEHGCLTKLHVRYYGHNEVA